MMLLLGSGVSLPTLKVGVTELTDAVLFRRWVQCPDRVYRPAPADFSSGKDATPLVQMLLRFLKSRADAYLAKRTAARRANYEDVFFLTRQLADDQWEGVDNPAVVGFVRDVTAWLQRRHGQKTRLSREIVAEIAEQACTLIQCAVKCSLEHAGETVGLELIRELAESAEIEALDIFTLNHDLLVEHLCRQHGIQFADGFGKADGQFRFFDSGVYNRGERVRLFKLHGSIDWLRFRPETGGVFGDRYGIQIGGRAFYGRDSSGTAFDNLDSEPFFLTGVQNKLAGYVHGPTAEMHWWFHRLLKEHTRVAVSGYGWRDRGINSRLIDWLYGATERRLCIMHPRPEELEVASTLLLQHLNFLAGERRITTVRKWMADVTASELLDALRS